MTTVKDVLGKKGDRVWYVTSSTTIQDALKLMAEKNIGAVPVIDGGQIVGIFSERDWVRKAIKANNETFDEPVRQVMTSPVYYVTPDQSMEECMSLMTNRHFRHIPVMENDELVGLISIGDVVKQIIVEKEEEISSLEDYIWVHMI